MEIIAGSATQLTTEIINTLANYRYQVFVKQLGWNLDTPAGIELDQFDRADTYYVLVRNLQQDIIGCARLLPTTQPYLLEAIFPQLLNGLSPPKTDEIWELSRFAAVDFNNATTGHANSGQMSSTIARTLISAVVQLAQEQGAKRLLLISFLGVERLLRHAGYNVHRAGAPLHMDGKWIIACWIEMPA